MRKWLGRALAVGCATVAIAAGAGTSAYAAQGDYGGDGIYIRSAPINGTAYGEGYPGQGSYAYWGIDCTNGYVNGNDFWDWNKDLATGVTGYSADYWLTEYADTYYYTGTGC